MSKQANPRRLADNEAKATVRMLRVSPQKLNLLAQLDPRQEGRDRARRSRILQQEDFDRGQEGARVGDRQRREQPRARRRRPRRRPGVGRQGYGDEALQPARPRPGRSHRKAVLQHHHRRARSRATKSKRPEERNDGSEDQSDRAAPRHQPHLGFALVLEQDGVRQAAARRHADPRRADEGAEAGRRSPRSSSSGRTRSAASTSTRPARAWSSARRAPTSTSCASRSRS